MPKPDACHPGCEDDLHCLCMHRVDPRVRIVHTSDVGITAGASDLRVTESFISLIRDNTYPVTVGTTIGHTRWVIATKDGGFGRSARHRHLSRVGGVAKDLNFCIPACCIWTKVDNEILLISVGHISARDGAERNELLGVLIGLTRRVMKDLYPTPSAP